MGGLGVCAAYLELNFNLGSYCGITPNRLLPAVLSNQMEKELFIRSIEALQKQIQHDISVSEQLGRAFPNSHSANLLPDNHYLHNALLEVLQVAMNDTGNCEMGQSWIEYYCFELDFGQENYRLKVYDKNKNEIPMATAGELWEFLKNGS